MNTANSPCQEDRRRFPEEGHGWGAAGGMAPGKVLLSKCEDLSSNPTHPNKKLAMVAPRKWRQENCWNSLASQSCQLVSSGRDPVRKSIKQTKQKNPLN